MTAVDNMQAHFETIAEDIESYHEDDKAFILWLLLREYIESCQKELKREDIEEYSDVKEYAMDLMLREHVKVGEQMRDVLFYQWS